jgi:hypothetical protein
MDDGGGWKTVEGDIINNHENKDKTHEDHYENIK